MQTPDRFRHRASLHARVGRHEHADRRRGSAAAGRHEVRLPGKVRVAPNEVGRAIQDSLVRAPVVRQGKTPAREQASDVVYLRITPPVDGLLRVAHHCYVAEAFCSRKANEVELDAVGVLELVDDEVVKTIATAMAELRHPLERVDDLEQEVVEVAEALLAQAVLVRAVDREQDVDGFELGPRRVRTTRAVGRWTAAPMPGVQVGRTLPEPLGADAAALELEQEAQPRAQQVVEVVHRQGRERVRVEWCRGTAAQTGDQFLLEQLLPGLVEDAHLAGRADQVGKLVQKARAHAVKRSDPAAVELLGREVGAACSELRGDP